MKLYRVDAYTANLNPVEYYITSETCSSDDLLDHFSKNKFTNVQVTQLSFENLEKLEKGESVVTIKQRTLHLTSDVQ